MKKLFIISLGLCCLFSCEDGRPELPSVEERIAASKEALLDELTDPNFGWRIDYKPTTNAGTFLILLDFDENGKALLEIETGGFPAVYQIDVAGVTESGEIIGQRFKTP